MMEKLFSADGPLSLLASKKAWVAIAGVVVAGVALYFAKITSVEFIDFLKTIVLAWIGALAVEKGALYLGPYPNGKPPTQPITTAPEVK